jgi:UDP:flavonoid glycosyltransferase YjiC (YdhE family)
VLGETFADSPFDIIVAAGDHPYFRGRDHYAAGNVHFYRIVPSHKIIPLSDLVIHHGGQNSTMQAIRAGVPALIFPGLHFERYFNALKAAQAGCARLYGNEDFNPRVLRTAVETALADGLLKKNCAVYSRKLKAAGGNAKAARTLLHPNK